MHTNETSDVQDSLSADGSLPVQDYLQSQIRTIPNWPHEGILFRDITTLFENPEAWRKTVDVLVKRYEQKEFDRIGALDARGFLMGSTLSYLMNKPLILFRKKGKLPGITLSVEYDLEYGKATLEMHDDSVKAGEKVLLVDDLIATGGTLLAADELLRKAGASTLEAAAIINLPDLKGADRLNQAGIATYSLCQFEGE
ncbi:adenine phosphoribosyltransferase [uncultured Endozoicomonas sp.]|uniref:adenine phosphoribosyltransferase n=1 Tax=uncultured Endozoicomonas sp. TaxID=432652 RepID=UPI002618BE3C|nr:adenine phosphoribosyltransferase [uncultured Endozoicomonas sp.]